MTYRSRILGVGAYVPPRVVTNHDLAKVMRTPDAGEHLMAQQTRDSVGTVLRSAGAAVITAGSAAEAFEHLTEQAFDVLVSDLAMPTRPAFDDA